MIAIKIGESAKRGIKKDPDEVIIDFKDSHVMPDEYSCYTVT